MVVFAEPSTLFMDSNGGKTVGHLINNGPNSIKYQALIRNGDDFHVFPMTGEVNAFSHASLDIIRFPGKENQCNLLIEYTETGFNSKPTGIVILPINSVKGGRDGFIVNRIREHAATNLFYRGFTTSRFALIVDKVAAYKERNWSSSPVLEEPTKANEKPMVVQIKESTVNQDSCEC